MRIFLSIFFLFSFLIAPNAQAQNGENAKIPRVLILLDGSSSMAEKWSTDFSRFQQAGNFILQLVDSFKKANSQVEFGLRVFGHQYPSQANNCYDTKLEIKFDRNNEVQMQARLEALHGYGVSPIAYSLSEAADEDFENENKYAYSIVMVTDGGESCEGDICKVVNDLLRRKIFFRPYIVSLVDYAPLKDLYKCLGTFLTVSNNPEMPIAISNIVDAHREGFERAKIGKIIPVIDLPVKKDSVVKPKSVIVVEDKPIKVDTIVIPFTVKTETPPIKKEEPPVQIREMKAPVSLPNPKLKTLKTSQLKKQQAQPLALAPFVLSKVGDAPPEPIVTTRTPEKLTNALAFAPAKTLKSKSIIKLPRPVKLNVPDFVLSKLEPPIQPAETTAVVKPKPDIKPIIKPAVKPIVKKEDNKPANFTIQKTPAAETLVSVFFTDGNGTFYSTTPQVLLTDPKTNKQASIFYRTVNPEGNPDPKKVLSGVYNLTLVGSDKVFLKDVSIEPNMDNKIVITVGRGSLQFVWKNSTSRKPVDKYFAIVNRLFTTPPQPVVRQRCDTILPYPPGTYHIDINTLPPMMRSIELSFGALMTIDIEEPGTVQVMNTNPMGNAIFYAPRGDRFIKFYVMNINGNPGAQKEEFQPGIYEVHYSPSPGLPAKTLTFHIKSNETFQLELK